MQSEKAILEKIGAKLAQFRIHSGITQLDLAKQAGVGKRTLEHLESGDSVQLTNFLRILRSLNLLDGMEKAVPSLGPSPMDLLNLRKKERKRATRSKPAVERKPWKWGNQT